MLAKFANTSCLRRTIQCINKFAKLKLREKKTSLFAFVFLACLPSALLADVTYSLTDLGDSSSGVNHINNNGQVVGRRGALGYVWENGVFTDIAPLPGGNGTSIPFRINDNGIVIGSSLNRAIRWQNGDTIDLGTSAEFSSIASGINSHGRIVGVDSGSAGNRIFSWENGVLADLGLGEPAAINDSGVILASTQQGSALIDGTDITLIGTLNGFQTNALKDLNNQNQAVGNSQDGVPRRAFLWSDGNLSNLGDLAGGNDFSEATGINNVGQIVGRSDSSEGRRAVIWNSDLEMQDLNNLLDESGEGWTLSAAVDINDSGQIVGFGASADGAFRTIVLTPNAVPEPSSLGISLLVATLALLQRRRNKP
jgi:probable HAF family extracellular repeat protein